jgi:hypothetical protein
MENSQTTIKCPKCGYEINVSKILYEQVQSQLEKEFDNRTAKIDEEYQNKMKAIQTEKDNLEKEKETIQKQIDDEVKNKLQSEKLKLEKSIREGIKEESAEQIRFLENELQEKSSQLKELNKTKAEIEKLKREKDELTDKIALEKEQEFSERLKDEKLKIKKQADESNALKIKELEKQLEDQKNLAEEMKRKAEQGSMQLQGEVQELAIEEILRATFIYDKISEVPKGIKGADVIHEVLNKSGLKCGTILYESKRTKNFSNEWIKKLNEDARQIKADICVIVTETLPEGIDKIGQKDGVWICSFNDFKGFAFVLRESLIKIGEAISSQTNKGDKMQMLYDYLTSNEFKLQINAIIEGFMDLQNSYHQEKMAMEKIWKQREKQLEKVLLNANQFIGSVIGIAGSSLPNLKQIGTSEK